MGIWYSNGHRPVMAKPILHYGQDPASFSPYHYQVLMPREIVVTENTLPTEAYSLNRICPTFDNHHGYCTYVYNTQSSIYGFYVNSNGVVSTDNCNYLHRSTLGFGLNDHTPDYVIGWNVNSTDKYPGPQYDVYDDFIKIKNQESKIDFQTNGQGLYRTTDSWKCFKIVSAMSTDFYMSTSMLLACKNCVPTGIIQSTAMTGSGRDIPVQVISIRNDSDENSLGTVIKVAEKNGYSYYWIADCGGRPDPNISGWSLGCGFVPRGHTGYIARGLCGIKVLNTSQPVDCYLQYIENAMSPYRFYKP